MKKKAVAVLAAIVVFTFATAFYIYESKSDFGSSPIVQQPSKSSAASTLEKYTLSLNSEAPINSSSVPTDPATNPSSDNKIDPYYGILSFAAITVSVTATIMIFVFIRKALKK